MDPLTALGAAANVVQFVGFAYGLISKTREISRSATGLSSDILTLEAVYNHLQRLSSDLSSPSPKPPPDPVLEILGSSMELAKNSSAIQDLWLTCKMDCDKLLEIVKKLISTGKPNTLWKSFKIALRTAWKAEEIAELEERLHRTQSTLTLHICTTINHWQLAQHRQFEKLRREGEQLNCQQSEKLNEITNILNKIQARMTDATIIKSADIASVEEDMRRLSLSKSDMVKEQIILKSLSFDSRPFRFNSITDAHKQTFNWAFQESSRSLDQSTAFDLLTWLRRGDGSFWISGKPGSGKSTFVKFLSDHPATWDALKKWASPKPAIIAAHYFWSAGTPMQKSQQGLYQTLLYEIFRQVPNLARIVCEKRWETEETQSPDKSWSLSEFSAALQKIADQETLPVRFCFFIDGLDEFKGDHLDFCHTLLNLSKSPNIKLCVASRPWNAFEDSFGKDNRSKLYIHDLTKDDIRSYTVSRLQDHPKWNDLHIAAANARWFVEEITERAAGVFLWVFLVTKQLRDGLTEYDSFSDLCHRLESIPTDLGTFFKDILSSVESFYHGKMATTIQLALAANEPMDTAIYSFHDEEYEDRDYALSLPFRPFTPEDIVTRRFQITRRLNGRCKGLLEVNSSRRVDFLHRTVIDFLRTREMFDFLMEKSPGWFDPNLSLLKAMTARLKSSHSPPIAHTIRFIRVPESKDPGLHDLINEILPLALLLDDPKHAYAYLDEIDRCMFELRKSAVINAYSPLAYFRQEIVRLPLTSYLRYSASGRPDYFSAFEIPALAIVIDLILDKSDTPRRNIHIGTLKYLLGLGQDPNATYVKGYNLLHTPWKDILIFTKDYDWDWILQSGLLTLLLKHGGDPNVYVRFAACSTIYIAWVILLLKFPKIPPQSSSGILYLQTLDEFISVGADICAHRKHGFKAPVVDTFFTALCDHLTNSSAQLNWPILTETTERILSMMRQAKLKVPGHYIPVLESSFTKETFDRLRRKYTVFGTSLMDGTSNSSCKTKKRKRRGRKNQ